MGHAVSQINLLTELETLERALVGIHCNTDGGG